MRNIQKKAEAKKSVEERHRLITQREKHTPKTVFGTEARNLKLILKDAVVFNAHIDLESRDQATTFLKLYQAAQEGKLAKHQTFTELCQVFEDRLRHECSDNGNAKFGVRYPRNYLDFMILMRSSGGNTGKQYGILTGALGGPSPRHLRCALRDSVSSPTETILM